MRSCAGSTHRKQRNNHAAHLPLGPPVWHNGVSSCPCRPQRHRAGADCPRWHWLLYQRNQCRAQIGLVPADDIADTSIPAGSISAAKLAILLRRPNDPGDTVVVLKLSGAQVLHALELGVGHAPQPFAGFWQVSGLQVRYDPSQPEGKRVSLAGAGGSEISASSTYTVAMTRSEALGDLGYFRVWSKKDITQDTGLSLSQSLLTYASAHNPLNVSGEARITAAH